MVSRRGRATKRWCRHATLQAGAKGDDKKSLLLLPPKGRSAVLRSIVDAVLVVEATTALGLRVEEVCSCLMMKLLMLVVFDRMAGWMIKIRSNIRRRLLFAAC